MDALEAAPSASPRSPAQIEASRRNGARSQGPVSLEGKARSARNATRHGLCAASFFLLPDEDPAEFQELLDEVAAGLAPQSAVERHWVEEVAFAMWRQKRLRRLSAAIFASVQFPSPEALLDDLEVEMRSPPPIGRELAAMARYRARIDKDIDKAMAILERFQRIRHAEEQAARQAHAQNEPKRRPSPSAHEEPVPNEPEAPQRPHLVSSASASEAASPEAAPPAPPQSQMSRQQRRYLERQAQKHHSRAS